MDGWVDGWMGGWMDGWMDGWMNGWIDRSLRTTYRSNVLWASEYMFRKSCFGLMGMYRNGRKTICADLYGPFARSRNQKSGTEFRRIRLVSTFWISSRDVFSLHSGWSSRRQLHLQHWDYGFRDSGWDCGNQRLPQVHSHRNGEKRGGCLRIRLCRICLLIIMLIIFMLSIKILTFRSPSFSDRPIQNCRWGIWCRDAA